MLRTVVLLVFWGIKIKNRDVAIHNWLNLSEGQIFVKEKVVLKKKLTIL